MPTKITTFSNCQPSSLHWVKISFKINGEIISNISTIRQFMTTSPPLQKALKEIIYIKSRTFQVMRAWDIIILTKREENNWELGKNKAVSTQQTIKFLWWIKQKENSDYNLLELPNFILDVLAPGTFNVQFCILKWLTFISFSIEILLFYCHDEWLANSFFLALLIFLVLTNCSLVFFNGHLARSIFLYFLNKDFSLNINKKKNSPYCFP